MPITPEDFRARVATLTAAMAGRPLDAALDAWLNHEHGVASPTYAGLRAACEAGVAEGWLCNREGGGIRYGRIFKPADDLHGFSVDVVDMADIAGPHHTHPNGEIDLVMPLDGDAPLRRPRRRLGGDGAGQRAPPHRHRRARAGAVPAAARRHRVHPLTFQPPHRARARAPDGDRP